MDYERKNLLLFNGDKEIDIDRKKSNGHEIDNKNKNTVSSNSTKSGDESDEENEEEEDDTRSENNEHLERELNVSFIY